jgi:hypothetical protein
MAMASCTAGLAALALLTVGFLKGIGRISARRFGTDTMPWLTTGIIALATMIAFALPWLIRSETVYILTTCRAMVWYKSVFGNSLLQSYVRDDLDGMRIMNESRGVGDWVMREKRVGSDAGEVFVQYGFKGIAKPRQIEAMVRRILSVPDGQKTE